ncbi:MAG: hypothetical protein SGARI_002998 [Bacillariaceae sp.]
MKRSISAPNEIPLSTMNKDGHSSPSPAKKQRLMQVMAASGAAKKFIIRPSDYAKAAFKSNGHSVQEVRAQYEAKLQTPSKDMIQAYGSKVLNLVRQGDLEGLKKAQEEGTNVQCCNRFGESLLHLACRRSYTEIADFLIASTGKKDIEDKIVENKPEDAKESSTTSTATATTTSQNMLHIRDDYQRTPLHDACWTVEPNLELVDLLLRHAPEQVVMEDVRGNTPFDYVRKDHYGMWLRFLWERKALLKPIQAAAEKEQESSEPVKEE